MRILLADDQSDFRLLTKEHLESSGHQVLAVASGADALTAFAKEFFDVILLDEEMPGMTGTEALQKIRARQRPSRPAVVIALTGYNTDTDRQRLLEAGFNAVLGKPFRFDVLEAILNDFAAGAFPAATPPAAPPALADSVAPLARVGGDQELLARMARTFLEDLPPRFAEMRKSIRRKDGEKLASGAHALQGSLGLFGADEAAARCRELQEFGRNGNFADASRTLANLKEAIAELEANLRGYAVNKRATESEDPPRTKQRFPGSKRKRP